jgi:hypothetical protein
MTDEVPPTESFDFPIRSQEGPLPSRLTRRLHSNALWGEIAAVVGTVYQRRKFIDVTLKVLLDVDDKNEMLSELADILVQEEEDDRFAEVFARACEGKIRQAESLNKIRRPREETPAEGQPATFSPRGLDLAAALTDILERSFSTDVERMKLLLTATRRYSLDRERRLRRPTSD